MSIKVSVVMACKNSNGELLTACIHSVLSQTYKDFEFIIVDDGSEISLENIVSKISIDSRIKVYRIESVGLGAALNYGINHSVGEYIARIDDDDLMTSDRLKKQVDFLDCHPEVSCVGGQRFSYRKGKYIKHRRFPIHHDEIIKSLLSLKWSMAHSVLMFRRSCFINMGGYRIKGAGQDVDLMIQLSLKGQLANIDEYLMYYHLAPASYSATNRKKRLKAYLFAFESIIASNCYPEYSKIIDNSIKTLTRNINSNQTPSFWKQKVLFCFINLFGKQLPLEL